ncbi:MAG: NERD domain-containing protein [Rhodoferax sp.]
MKVEDRRMPRVIGPASFDKWEREVRRELARQLPADWTVVSNISWAARDERGVVRDGQCDFVVLAPDLGMLILEVKGSRSVRVAVDGQWYRQEVDRRTGAVGAEQLIAEPPPAQASRNMHTLARLICERAGYTDFPGAYAFMVAYPQGTVTAQHPMFDRSTIVTAKEMQKLAAVLRESLQARLQRLPNPRFSADVAARVAAVLSGDGFRVLRTDTPLDSQEDADALELLTRQQYAALRGAFELPRVAVTGPAGSGKTMLALWKLEALSEEGKRALYVCYNTALAAHATSANRDLATAIRSVDSLFLQITKPPRGNTPADIYYGEVLPAAVLDASANMSDDEKYDTIIVDEGQDFGDARLMALFCLLRDKGHWMVMADFAQDVYRRGAQDILGTEVTFRLFHNCRNTELVNSATNGYCTQSVQAMPGVPHGTDPEVLACNSWKAMAARAWETAKRLAPEAGAVFLSPYKLENSCMAEETSGHGLRLSIDLNDLGKPGVIYFSTIRSFKGLEAKVVVLLHADIPGRSPSFMHEDLYVACTRATSRLVILAATQQAKDWFSGAARIAVRAA